MNGPKECCPLVPSDLCQVYCECNNEFSFYYKKCFTGIYEEGVICCYPTSTSLITSKSSKIVPDENSTIITTYEYSFTKTMVSSTKSSTVQNNTPGSQSLTTFRSFLNEQAKLSEQGGNFLKT